MKGQDNYVGTDWRPIRSDFVNPRKKNVAKQNENITWNHMRPKRRRTEPKMLEKQLSITIITMLKQLHLLRPLCTLNV